VVVKAMNATSTPVLRRATLGITSEQALKVTQYIPDHISMFALRDIFSSCTQVGKNFAFQTLELKTDLEEASHGLTMDDRILISHVPVGRHQVVADTLCLYLKMYKSGEEVPYREALEEVGLLTWFDKAKEAVDQLRSAGLVPSNESEIHSEIPLLPATPAPSNEMQDASAEHSPPESSSVPVPVPRAVVQSLLLPLEQIHQALSCYVWLSYRLMAFSKAEEAVALKDEVLDTLQTILHILAIDPWKPDNQSDMTVAPKPVEKPLEYTRMKVGSRMVGYTSISGMFESMQPELKEVP